MSHNPDSDSGSQRKVPYYFPWTAWQRPQQQAVALLAILVMGVMVSSVAVRWWIGGGLIEIDSSHRDVAAFRVDINSASWPELANLPGVGDTLAQRIVDYRATHGPFRELEDLQKVPGIGPSKFARLRVYLSLDAAKRRSRDSTVESRAAGPARQAATSRSGNFRPDEGDHRQR